MAGSNLLFEIGDALSANDYGGFTLSADGGLLALSRLEYVRSSGMKRSRIGVLALERGDPRALPEEAVVFTGGYDGWAPEWHDDGQSLQFLTDVAGEARPWMAPGPGEEAAPVAAITRMGMVAKWRPCPSGTGPRGLAFLSFATRAEQDQGDPLIWDTVPDAGYRHLHVVEDVTAAAGAPGALRRITDGPADVYDFAWSPDGKYIAVLVAPSFEMEQHLHNEVRIFSLADGEVVSRHATERGLNAFLSWSPAGTHLAYIAHGPGGHVGKPDLYTLRLADGKITCVSADVPGYVSRYDWAPGGAGLWFPSAEGVSTALYHAPLGTRRDRGGDRGSFGKPRAIFRPEAFIGGMSVARRGRRIAFRLEGPRSEAVLAVADLEGEKIGPLRIVTPRNARREARIPGDAVVLDLKASDHHPVDAVVLHPRRGKPKKRPLCVWLHGGPNEFCALSYQPWWQLFVARGYTVLAPNYRGSGSYEEARVRKNVGDLGGGDAGDVIAAIDAAAAHPAIGPHVDPSRIVLFGWSYGAHLAFHVVRQLAARTATAKKKRLHLAGPESVRRVVAGGGVYDWLSHYGQTELRFPWRDYLGGSPLLDSRQADARSPIRHIPALKTGLVKGEAILVHGLNDGRAHVFQARAMFRALDEAEIRSTLVIYPREAHVLVEPEHVRDLLDRATLPLP